MIISRRGLLLGAFSLAAIGRAAAAVHPLPIPPGNRLAFDVIRNGSRIGGHTLDFVISGDRLDVHIAVDLAIGIGPVTLFRYTHRALETWAAGQVQSIDARTNHDGTRHHLTMSRRANGFWVSGDKGSYLAPPETLPATHWTRRTLDGPMVNTETGALMHPQVSDRGIETLMTASAMPLQARHFSLSGDVSLETWYDRSPRWVGLGFAGADGSKISYVLADS